MKAHAAMLCSLCAVGLVPAAAGAAERPAAPLVHEIDQLRARTNALRLEAGLRPIRPLFAYRHVQSLRFRLFERELWVGRLRHARRAVIVPPVWRRLAVCETGGNWRHRNARYQGGLGFYSGSWDAYRPRRFPADADRATPAQQVAVGRRIRADVGWGAWPTCSIRLGLR